MLEAPTMAIAKEVMKPIQSWVTPATPAAEALRIMRDEDGEFLLVIAEETEKLLGLVLRRALERGCENMGHDTNCRVLNHLKGDVDFCFQDEPVEEVLSGSRELDDVGRGQRGARARTRLNLPVIIVDERKVPVGTVERPS